MRTVSPEEIESRIGIAALLPVMRDALRAEADGRVEVPLRAGWSLDGGAFGFLLRYLPVDGGKFRILFSGLTDQEATMHLDQVG